jgi:hypothetical protein
MVDDSTLATGFRRMARGMSRTALPITDEARVSFHQAFPDYSPDRQVAIEKDLQPGSITYTYDLDHPGLPEYIARCRLSRALG